MRDIISKKDKNRLFLSLTESKNLIKGISDRLIVNKKYNLFLKIQRLSICELQ